MSQGPSKPEGGEQRWGSRLGLILAVAGSAVGLGNFLRFPGQAVQNGGGAFMIPYLCALLLLGIPIGWAEWAMGRYGGTRGRRSAPGILALVGGPWARYLGALGVLIPLVVYMYYGLIESWCLRYAWAYLVGGIQLAPGQEVAQSKALFVRFSGSGQDGVLLGGSLDPAVVFWAIVLGANVWLVHRGLSGGIERFCRWAMPLMGVCALVVLGRVLTLGTPDPALPDHTVTNGLGFMWNPQLDRLGRFDTWLAAAGQIFFTLGVGFGIVINYAAYVRPKDDIALSGLTASAINEVFEVVFGGLITVTAAFVFLGASGAVGGTFGLGFNTLPVVFAHMGTAGRFVGATWFFMLFLAAITSSISMLQPVVAFLEEALALARGRAVTVVTVLAVVGSAWVIWFSKDLVALDTMDFWVGTVAIFLLATVQTISFGWVLGTERGYAELQRGAEIKVPAAFRFVIKFVTPAYLLVVLVGFCLKNLPDYVRGLSRSPVARATMVFVAAVLVLVLVVTWLGARRERAAVGGEGRSA
jgi:SNF family Na+-dependent transporter